VLLEKENKRLVATVKKYQVAQPEKPDQEEGKKARFTSKGILALRKKLRLSQADFGSFWENTWCGPSMGKEGGCTEPAGEDKGSNFIC